MPFMGLVIYEIHVNHVLLVTQVKTMMLIKWSRCPPPPTMLTNEPNMVIIY